MDLPRLLTHIAATPHCHVFPPRGLPSLQAGHVMPDDLQQFYHLCGGVHLFAESAFPLRIVPPEQVVLANPTILIGLTVEQMPAPDDKSWSWYIIGAGASFQWITIDLSPERLGRCYDSFWDKHPFESSIIAHSFTAMLTSAFQNHGQEDYWSHPAFKPLGNAYPD